MRFVTYFARADYEIRDRRAERLRWVFLTLAALWMLVGVAVVVAHHVPEPSGELSVTVNGHTYLGNPPALTLEQRDPVSAAFVLGAMGVGVVVGFVDALTARHAHRASSGIASIIAGGLVVLFSLFGLLYGLASIGVVGALVIVSGIEGRVIAGPATARQRGHPPNRGMPTD